MPPRTIRSQGSDQPDEPTDKRTDEPTDEPTVAEEEPVGGPVNVPGQTPLPGSLQVPPTASGYQHGRPPVPEEAPDWMQPGGGELEPEPVVEPIVGAFGTAYGDAATISEQPIFDEADVRPTQISPPTATQPPPVAPLEGEVYNPTVLAGGSEQSQPTPSRAQTAAEEGRTSEDRPEGVTPGAAVAGGASGAGG